MFCSAFSITRIACSSHFVTGMFRAVLCVCLSFATIGDLYLHSHPRNIFVCLVNTMDMVSWHQKVMSEVNALIYFENADTINIMIELTLVYIHEQRNYERIRYNIHIIYKLWHIKCTIRLFDTFLVTVEPSVQV